MRSLQPDPATPRNGYHRASRLFLSFLLVLTACAWALRGQVLDGWVRKLDWKQFGIDPQKETENALKAFSTLMFAAEIDADRTSENLLRLEIASFPVLHNEEYGEQLLRNSSAEELAALSTLNADADRGFEDIKRAKEAGLVQFPPGMGGLGSPEGYIAARGPRGNLTTTGSQNGEPAFPATVPSE